VVRPGQRAAALVASLLLGGGAAATVSALSSCGPRADDYPLLRPDAGLPDGYPAYDAGLTNLIEDEPLEPWDTTGAGPLSGIFAVEAKVRANVVVDLDSLQLLRLRILQQGQQLRLRSQFCRLRMPSIQGVATMRIPLALEMVMRSKGQQFEGAFLGPAEPPGSPPPFQPPPFLILLGAELGDPMSDPLPTGDDPTSAVDEDGDGQPAVSLAVDSVLCGDVEQLYTALRTVLALSGQVDDSDRLSGVISPVLEQSVIGYSEPCLAAAANLEIEVLPGSTFRAVRVGDEWDINDNGNITCGEIVVAAPTLFGGVWEQEP